MPRSSRDRAVAAILCLQLWPTLLACKTRTEASGVEARLASDPCLRMRTTTRPCDELGTAFAQADQSLMRLLLPNSMARTTPRSSQEEADLILSFDSCANVFAGCRPESTSFLARGAPEVSLTALELLWSLHTPEALAAISAAQRSRDEVVARTATEMMEHGSNLLDGFATAPRSDILPFTTVLPVEQGPAVLKQCSRQRPAASEFWTPTTEDVMTVETALTRYWSRASCKFGLDRLSRYYRQYIGVVIDGRRKIYINALHGEREARELTDRIDEPQGWRERAAVWCDGGGAYWGVEYDPDAATFGNFACNCTIGGC